MIETIIKPTEQQMKYMVAIENYMLGENQNEAGIDFSNAEIVEDGDVAEDPTIVNDDNEDSKVDDKKDSKNIDLKDYIEKIEGNIVFLKKLLPDIEIGLKKNSSNLKKGFSKDFEMVETAASRFKNNKVFVIQEDEGFRYFMFEQPLAKYDNLTIGGDEPEFVRIMKGLSFMRTVALSPYLFKRANLGMPTAQQVVETSPKIKYVMECIRVIKNHQESEKIPMKGIIIYCNLGTNKSSFGFSLLELLAEYLTSKNGIGFKDDEVKLIYSKTTKSQREVIKSDFNQGRVKVVIGSGTIKEGIDLQKNTVGLFNLTVDWNPTDSAQLEGRCHRQGNKNAYVFINYPLVADSADVVYFQKLQDKTSRIKEIWDRENIKSDMDLKDFDPNQIKADLMTRADKIAIIEEDIDISKIKLNSSFRKYAWRLLNINLFIS
jgi:superfamily II DNA or RNA helicase